MGNISVEHFIKNYSERLRLDGFTVYNIIEDPARVPEINGVKPEIVARESCLERIIVVKPEEDYRAAKADLDKLKENVMAQKHKSFWGFTVDEESWKLVDNII